MNVVSPARRSEAGRREAVNDRIAAHLADFNDALL
jgi:hypothetical protein